MTQYIKDNPKATPQELEAGARAVAKDSSTATEPNPPKANSEEIVSSIMSQIDDNQLKMLKRSEEHTSELQSHSFISYAVFCLKKKKNKYINFLIGNYIHNQHITK